MFHGVQFNPSADCKRNCVRPAPSRMQSIKIYGASYNARGFRTELPRIAVIARRTDGRQIPDSTVGASDEIPCNSFQKQITYRSARPALAPMFRI